ncbi:sugar ABC transporter ATP-binding protein [Streptomyces sp. NPDC101225]|uniref:sugar ABC transporter ATP-binding protein n=1 Tax=Streptomyces sp. NPDC101225 TaxID=3366135 RepID=UPI0037FEFAF4
MDVALHAERLSKTFPGNRALDNVSLQVRRGEVHALAGGNGCGKSTLIKVLAGVHRGDPGGTITVHGQQTTSDAITPEWARRTGMRFVHQDLGLFNHLTVAENVFTSSDYPKRFGHIDWGRVRREAAATLERLNIRVPPTRLLGDLRPAERTLVAIARALHGGAQDGHVLVLDEPTAPLPAAEVDMLLEAVRRFAAAGEAIVYVSHRLDEILDVCDRVTVLRDGQYITERETREMTQSSLVADIVGGSIDSVYPDMPPVREAAPILSVRGLSGGPLTDVSFTLRPGEVLGIAGLVGSGRSALLEMLFGVRPRAAGEVIVDGQPVSATSPREAMRARFAYVPENRARDAAFLDLGIPENMSAADPGRYSRNGIFRHRQERAAALNDITAMNIRTPSVTATVDQLSGGNQQKVILGRWLRQDALVLLLDEPTQGVDIGSRSEIYQHVRTAVARGAAAIVVSSDFEELANVSDRVLILSNGRIAAEKESDINREWITEQVFLGMRSGVQ